MGKNKVKTTNKGNVMKKGGIQVHSRKKGKNWEVMWSTHPLCGHLYHKNDDSTYIRKSYRCQELKSSRSEW